MPLNTCLDWFKKLRLFSYVLHLKIDVVSKVSRWGYLNLLPIICLILKQINIFFNTIAKKSLN